MRKPSQAKIQRYREILTRLGGVDVGNSVDDEKLSETVRELLRKRASKLILEAVGIGMPRQELADAIGVHKSTLSHICDKGPLTVGVERLNQMVAALPNAMKTWAGKVFCEVSLRHGRLTVLDYCSSGEKTAALDQELVDGLSTRDGITNSAMVPGALASIQFEVGYTGYMTLIRDDLPPLMKLAVAQHEHDHLIQRLTPAEASDGCTPPTELPKRGF